MIDINKMRRLAQAATPGPWVAAGPSFGESLPKYLNEVAVDREGDEDDGYSICNAPIGLNEECSDDMAFIAEANPLTIEELLDRLEAAEKSRDDLLAGLGEWLDKTKWVQQGVNEGTISAKYLGLHRADVMSSLLGEAEKARDALRAEVIHIKEVEFPRKAQAVADGWRGKCERLEAKIAEMEKQEPYAFAVNMKLSEKIQEALREQQEINLSDSAVQKQLAALWGYVPAEAQPAPSVPDVDALAQFIREIDGAHQLGAGVLAERIVEWLAAPEAKP